MAYQALLTDLDGVARKFLRDYSELKLTRRLGDACEANATLDVRESAVSEALIAERALKLYGPDGLLFNGQLWEPLELNEQNAVIVARDPYAAFKRRRVREAVTYTDTDAGAIITARLAAQESESPTLLAIDADESVTRTVTYEAGKLEGEIVDELGGMADGYFIRVDALDETPGTMATLRVLYPDAGTTRAEARFGYGANTVDNLAGFKLVRQLPLNRLVVSSQDPEGGRIAAAAEDTDSIERYGLFEDEQSFTDVDDTDLLQAVADAGVRPEPPMTVELTPGPNAPIAFDAFDVGDFVQLNLQHGSLAVNTWARVIEATLSIDENGNAQTSSLVVETISGARANVDPARLFRAQLDRTRSRLEALERRVQAMGTTPVASGGAPTPSGGSGGGGSPSTDTPPPPPPPAPPSPPTIGASWSQAGRTSARVTASYNCGGAGSGIVAIGGATFGVSGSGSVTATVTGASGSSFSVGVYISTSAGNASTSVSVSLDPDYGT